MELKSSREFRETLRQYEKLTDKSLNFNPDDCSWKDVLEELNKARKASAESEERSKGFFTKNRRKMSRISPIITPVLDALPDNLCFLHGGLAVIFNVSIVEAKIQMSTLRCHSLLNIERKTDKIY